MPLTPSTTTPVAMPPAPRSATPPRSAPDASILMSDASPSERPAPLPARLLAVPPALVAACLVAPLPTLALPSLGPVAAWTGGGDPAVLLRLPLFAIFTGLFAGPFALPVLVVMAVRNARSVGANVLAGSLVTLPAMGAFELLFGLLTGPVVGAILGGGALGGLVASAVRDRIEGALAGALAGGRWHGGRRRAHAVAGPERRAPPPRG